MQHFGKEYDFGWLEDGLQSPGFRLVLVTRHPGSFVDARPERLNGSGNPSQNDDLNFFIRVQELMRDLAERSRLQILGVDVSTEDVGRDVERIAHWMETSVGLYL